MINIGNDITTFNDRHEVTRHPEISLDDYNCIFMHVYYGDVLNPATISVYFKLPLKYIDAK